VAYIDEPNDYQVGATGGMKLVGDSGNVFEMRFPLVLTEAYARTLSEIIIQETWAARESGKVVLPPSMLAKDPGDAITIPIGDREVKARITSISRAGHIEVAFEGLEESLYDSLDVGAQRNGNTSGVSVFGFAQLKIMELPLVNGDEASPWAPRVVGYQKPFPQAIALYQDISAADDPASYELANLLELPAIMGETTTALASNDPWIFNRSKTVDVLLYDSAATLSSVSETEVLNGANACAFKNANGDWEVAQFATATLSGTVNGLPKYKLGSFIRGQLGTEVNIDASLVIGSEFVFLQGLATYEVALSQSQKLFATPYLYGPSNLAFTSDFYQAVTHTGEATGLKPYAPSGLKKVQTLASTEVTFTWYRRTRFDGDDFDAEFTPLNEESELYDLEIYNPSGPTLLRTETDLTSPTFTYTTANQATDGGALSEYIIKVWQKSSSIGRGREATATF